MMHFPSDWLKCSDFAVLKSKEIQPPQFSRDAELDAADVKIHEILPRLFLGNQQAAGKPMERNPDWEEKKQFLKEKGITHILCCTEDQKHYFPEDFTYGSVPLNDVSDADISRHFDSSFLFIEEGLKKGGVLVHCAAGVSRSSSIMIAYLIRKFMLNYEEAYHFVKSKRPCVEPNEGFKKQLQDIKNIIPQSAL